MEKNIDIKQAHLLRVQFTDPEMDLEIKYEGNLRGVIEAWRPDLLSQFDQWALELFAERGRKYER
jgi:hypothetical protein